MIVPLLLGKMMAQLINEHTSLSISGVALWYLLGNILMYAVFQVIAVPEIFLKRKFSEVVVIWCVVTGILLVISIISLVRHFHINRIKQNITDTVKSTFVREKIGENILTTVVAIAAVLVVGWQMWAYYHYMYLDEDDSRYVVVANDAYDSDEMFTIDYETGDATEEYTPVRDLISPWSIYIALLSKLVGIYPTIVAHTILPVFLVLMAYCAYWLIADVLFKGKLLSCFTVVLVAAIANMEFGNSVYTEGVFLLTRVWQGKAVVAGIMIPVMIYLMYVTHYKEKRRVMCYVLLGLADAAMCLMSGIGIFFAGIMIAVYGVWSVIMSKRWVSLIGYILASVPTIAYGLLYATLK
jgi:hypothetical protein